LGKDMPNRGSRPRKKEILNVCLQTFRSPKKELHPAKNIHISKAEECKRKINSQRRQ